MPRRSTVTLSGRAVDGLSVAGKDQIFWDRELPGFGVRVYPSGRKVYVVQSRGRGGPKRVTLGSHGELTTTQARLRAAQVIDRIKGGREPIPPPPQAGATIADLAARYLSAHVAQNCNAHTAGIYRGSLENHILPALGMMPLAMVETAHVASLHYRLRETPRAANRALSVLSKMFSLACAWGLAAEGTNPCRGVRKYKEKKRERFLTRDEYRRLGQALVEAMTLAHRVAVMDEGVLQQVAPPKEIYDDPANLFVARFIGAPAMNIVRGTVENGSFAVQDGTVPLGSVAARGDVYLGFRPEDAALAPVEEAMLRARIYSTEMTGNETIVTCDMNGEQVVIRADKDYEGALDAAVGIELDPDKARLFDCDSGNRIRR